MQIDVVIPSWNRAELLADCLEHLARQTISHRTIVADNGSEDGTAALVRERFQTRLSSSSDRTSGSGGR